MSNTPPALSEIYEAAGPSGEVDSRAGTVFITSIALLAFSLAHKPPEDIDLFGMKFSITEARAFGFALWLVMLYSVAQLWLAWYTTKNIFELKYGAAWTALLQFFSKAAGEQRELWEKVLSETNKNASLQERRRQYRSPLDDALKALSKRADEAFAAHKASLLRGDDRDMIAKKAAEAEGANQDWSDKVDEITKTMALWDQEHPQGDTAAGIIPDALERQRVNWQHTSLTEAHMKRAMRLLVCRRLLELIGPVCAALIATACFFGRAL